METRETRASTFNGWLMLVVLFLAGVALSKLEEHRTIELDEERKAAMVSNLLVVLCGHEHAQPVVNAGTLYS